MKDRPEQERGALKWRFYCVVVAIPVFLLISMIFFMIGSIDGAMFGTPEGEVDNIVTKKIKEIMQNVAD